MITLLLRLYFEFFKTGLFAVGGGMATLPFLYNMSDATGWFTYEDLANMVAISESTPGPIGVNMATYAGFTTAGPLGAVVATLGLITPSIIVILIVARILKAFKDNKTVQSAFYGLRPASTGLIAGAGFSVLVLALCNTALYEATGNLIDLFNFKCILLAILIFIGTNYIPKIKKLHPIVFIAFSAVVGALFGFAGA